MQSIKPYLPAYNEPASLPFVFITRAKSLLMWLSNPNALYLFNVLSLKPAQPRPPMLGGEGLRSLVLFRGLNIRYSTV